METGGSFVIRDFMIAHTKCYQGDRVEKSEIAGVCGWYGGEENYKEGFGKEI